MAVRNNHNPQETLLRGGFARCAYCGRALQVSHPHRSRDGARHPQYRCFHSIRSLDLCTHHGIMAHLLDAAVWTAIKEELTHLERIAQEVAHMQEMKDPGADTLAIIDTQIADVTRRIRSKRQLAEYVTDETETRELAAEIDHLAAHRRALEGERAATEHHYAQFRQQREGLERVLDAFQRVGDKLDTMPYDMRRLTLHALQATVLLYRTDRADGPRAELTIHLPLSGDIPLDCDLQTLVSRHSTRSCSWAR
jgi:hypothetical protein